MRNAKLNFLGEQKSGSARVETGGIYSDGGKQGKIAIEV